MVDDVVIRAEGLGKKYLIGHQTEHERYTTLRDMLARGVKGLGRKAADLIGGHGLMAGDTVEEFWALKDVDFEVRRGEVVGIIGRNGAGKSTLLKILSRITEPSEGRVAIKGRVASLLEVGTGFHPELTGRENVYLNGAILGMTRNEIRGKFDEIVAFSEVEKFLDTPVKRYSSGMYVRLAFAVAAHLDPEILVVDEVLAVGDAEFQKKCLGKMSEVASQSRTVLFVSHNLSAVKSLTQKCILMDKGRIAASGETETIAAAYLAKAMNVGGALSPAPDLNFFRRSRKYDPHAEITRISIDGRDQASEISAPISLGTKLVINIDLTVYRVLQETIIGIVFKTSQGEPIAALASSDHNFRLSLDPGDHTVTVTIGDLPLAPGSYYADIGVDSTIGGESADVIFGYPLLSVVNDGQVTHWLNRPWGVVHCRQVEWIAA